MRKLAVAVSLLMVVMLATGCVIENRVISSKTWDAKPADISVDGKVNTSNSYGDTFVDYTNKWIEFNLKNLDYTVTSGASLELSYTVDELDPGNRWLRWLAGAFGAGQGYAQGKVTVSQGGRTVGTYEYAVVQRGGFFGGTLEDMAMEAARGIAKKIHNKNFDDELYGK